MNEDTPLKFTRDEHGHVTGKFTDLFQQECILQQIAPVKFGGEALCLEIRPREMDQPPKLRLMLLSRDMVKAMLPALQQYVETGKLPGYE